MWTFDTRGTCLVWSDGEVEHDEEVDQNSCQWNQVVVSLGGDRDIDNKEDDEESKQQTKHDPTRHAERASVSGWKIEATGPIYKIYYDLS